MLFYYILNRMTHLDTNLYMNTKKSLNLHYHTMNVDIFELYLIFR